MKTFFVPSLLFTCFTILSSCKKSPFSKKDPRKKMQAAIDKIRKFFYDSPGNLFSSWNLLNHTPTIGCFVSSSGGPKPLVNQDTFYAFTSNTKNDSSGAIRNMFEGNRLDYTCYFEPRQGYHCSNTGVGCKISARFNIDVLQLAAGSCICC